MKPWTKKAELHFKRARMAILTLNYHLYELRKELRYRPADKDSLKVWRAVLDTTNKLAREKIWPLYERHNPEGYAIAFPDGPRWKSKGRDK